MSGPVSIDWLQVQQMVLAQDLNTTISIRGLFSYMNDDGTIGDLSLFSDTFLVLIDGVQH